MIAITVLGGSGAFTPELAFALSQWRAGRPALRLILHGRDGEKLARVAAACRKVLAGADPPIEVETQTAIAPALADASFVLNQVRVGGLAARAFDETFPHQLGLPGEETVGLGGVANALRTVPVALRQGADLARHAPDAWVINLTNPASIVGQALVRGMQSAGAQSAAQRVLGVCDAPLTLEQNVAALLDRPADELSFSYMGINHFGWLLSARHGSEELLPQVLARCAELPGNQIDAEVIQASGALPNPHLRYLYHPERMLRAQLGKAPRAAQLLEVEAGLLAEYERPDGPGRPAALEQRNALWYHAVIVPVLDALINDRRAVQVINLQNGALFPWLPRTTTVEVPAVIGREGAWPLAQEMAQPELRALLEAQATYESVLLEAIVEGSRSLALRALLANPFIQTADQAVRALDMLWSVVLPR
jgi:6-phospho-beta-glucosidase